MKRILKKLVPVGFLCLLTLLFLAPVAAHAQANQLSTDPGGGNDNITGGVGVNDFTTGASESTGLTNTLMAVAHYALYVFYVLGIIFMGIAAIKFKGGDMEAMGKNLGGAVCLFLVPKIVEVIISWAQR
jgi:hypothetical protein